MLASTDNIRVKQPLNNSQPNYGEYLNRFVIESGHKRKRDHDDLLFKSTDIRPLRIVLERIDVSKIRSHEQLEANGNHLSKVFSKNCMIDEESVQSQNKRIVKKKVQIDTKIVQIDEVQESNEVNIFPSTRKQPSRKAKVASIVSEETKLSKKVNRKTGAKNKVVPFKKTKNAEEFVPGEIVLAHVTGYCEWPAFIKSIHDQILVVEFFGTGQV